MSEYVFTIIVILCSLVLVILFAGQYMITTTKTAKITAIVNGFCNFITEDGHNDYSNRNNCVDNHKIGDNITIYKDIFGVWHT